MVLATFWLTVSERWGCLWGEDTTVLRCRVRGRVWGTHRRL